MSNGNGENQWTPPPPVRFAVIVVESCRRNSANEVAVASFLERRIAFLDIPRLIEAVLGKVARAEVRTLQDVLDADAAARSAAQEWIAQ